MSKNCSDNHTRPTIAQALFPNMDSDKLWYWSSSPYARDASSHASAASHAWVVYFSYGLVIHSNRDLTNYVRLVR